MPKNILVLVGSPRHNGNTELLADAFIKGAIEDGNTVTKYALQGKKYCLVPTAKLVIKQASAYYKMI